MVTQGSESKKNKKEVCIYYFHKLCFLLVRFLQVVLFYKFMDGEQE